MIFINLLHLHLCWLECSMCNKGYVINLRTAARSRLFSIGSFEKLNLNFVCSNCFNLKNLFIKLKASTSSAAYFYIFIGSMMDGWLTVSWEISSGLKSKLWIKWWIQNGYCFISLLLFIRNRKCYSQFEFLIMVFLPHQ